ncbi:hypothetical protein EJ04DRAFT_515476 [Polyplosphaeria fusca]|uniref:Uncharacterized protein n=1 Tax=Polyplosphaeria fusca TaxID=682080 RepID=A0A9P4QSJ8_9PLEO|nr:hypothetical protein EJ04DRAFT_515476 [Polyplosphaeria fusca]
MLSTLLLGAIAVIALYLLSRYQSLARNLAAARSSGLPIVVTPWYVYAVPSLATAWLWLPLLKRLLGSRKWVE